MKSFTIGNGHGNGQQAQYHQGGEYAFMEMNPQQVLNSTVGAQYSQDIYAGMRGQPGSNGQM
jgi:hypothetical protein